MPSLILTALSVIVVAFALVAGTNFVNPSVQSRIEVARVLGAQYAAISSAIASYRVENQGVRPETFDEVKGYVAAGAIEGFGRRSRIFSWSIAPDASGQGRLCLSYVAGGESDEGTLMGLQRFALDMEGQRPGRLTFSQSCSGEPLELKVGALADRITGSGENLTIRFEDR